MKKIFYYEMTIGKIKIVEYENSIVELAISMDRSEDHVEVVETDLIKKTAKQLREYLEGNRKVFSVPMNPIGTTFQKKVWNILQRIPYGETWSYKQVAEAIGNPKACRAVGMANNKNPIMIMIPCHRVIGTNGKLIGYAGGLGVKEVLLGLEK